jgi:hypothetical protein
LKQEGGLIFEIWGIKVEIPEASVFNVNGLMFSSMVVEQSRSKVKVNDVSGTFASN